MLRAFALLAIVAVPAIAHAQDQFEIQVYDSETAERGDVGLETHLNYMPNEPIAHLTLEPHVGLARWCEAGAYFQTALRPDGELDYAGVKLRFKARVPRKLAHGLVGLALNGELSSVPARYEASPLGGELRPVIDVEWRRLYASVNPILSFDFFGADAGHPQLEPAATLLLALVEDWRVGVEYYGVFGPIDAPLPADKQVHRLFVVSTLTYKWFGLHVGGGYGLAAGDKWIAKMILSFDFGAMR